MFSSNFKEESLMIFQDDEERMINNVGDRVIKRADLAKLFED